MYFLSGANRLKSSWESLESNGKMSYCFTFVFEKHITKSGFKDKFAFEVIISFFLLKLKGCGKMENRWSSRALVFPDSHKGRQQYIGVFLKHTSRYAWYCSFTLCFLVFESCYRAFAFTCYRKNLFWHRVLAFSLYLFYFRNIAFGRFFKVCFKVWLFM